MIWPVYFDSRVSRRRGRKTSTKLSITSPTCEQIIDACRRLGWDAEKAVGSRPSTWWRKTGYVLVRAGGVSKSEVVRRIAGVLKKVG